MDATKFSLIVTGSLFVRSLAPISSAVEIGTGASSVASVSGTGVTVGTIPAAGATGAGATGAARAGRAERGAGGAGAAGAVTRTSMSEVYLSNGFRFRFPERTLTKSTGEIRSP